MRENTEETGNYAILTIAAQQSFAFFFGSDKRKPCPSHLTASQDSSLTTTVDAGTRMLHAILVVLGISGLRPAWS